ncbi:MAG: helix-turn-helix transcriptional regulator [Anaerolineae bacterium]|nr:helix-turn-helix transcriptional regulator [Anaerolineae bacterium]
MSSDSKKKLGERVRRARLDADLKQADLAEKLGISQGVISNVETGVSTIDAPDLPRWAAALGKPIMFFFIDESMTRHERAAAVLSMFPEERIDFVLQMLETLALTLREQNGS